MVLKRYLEQLRHPLPQLTTPHKGVIAAVFTIAAASRFAAISRSLSDWDETLFCWAIRDYDVSRDHPHAPGYPIFIAMAKLLGHITETEFQALQSVNVIAAVLLFPAALMLARELRLPFRSALIGSTLFVFFPTVWYFGGTGFSDVPALTATTFASALLLRGGRSGRAYVAGMLLAAVAAAIRPTSVLVVAVPALLGAAAARSPRMLVRACTLAGFFTIACYVVAAYASGDPPHGYLRTLKTTADYVRSDDSYRNPDRPPLRTLMAPILLEPFRGGRAGHLVLCLAVAGFIVAVIRYPAASAVLLAMFTPLALFTWISLDVTSATRYAVAYVSIHALFAAITIDALAEAVGRIRPSLETAAATAAAVVPIAALVTWVWPTLRIVSRTDAPVVAALKWVNNNVSRNGAKVFLENELALHAEYLLQGREYTVVHEQAPTQREDYRPGNVYVVEGEAEQPGARIFRRPAARRLREIARPRYLEVAVIPMEKMIRFIDGWYEEESDAVRRWRWMSGESITALPALNEHGELRMSFHVPLDLTPRPPLMTVTWNGSVVDRRVCSSAELDCRYILESRTGDPNELRITVDIVGNPARAGVSGDSRNLGLMLRSISWKPIRMKTTVGQQNSNSRSRKSFRTSNSVHRARGLLARAADANRVLVLRSLLELRARFARLTRGFVGRTDDQRHDIVDTARALPRPPDLLNRTVPVVRRLRMDRLSGRGPIDKDQNIVRRRQ
jgi:hypothetical protein